ncbi:Reverse transcriptase zinc-binding domain, partial [Sesbania bispinosa]
MIDSPFAKVSEYVRDDGSWDLLRLSGVLPPPSIFVKVQAMIPPSPDKGPDLIAWGKNVDGSFTIASAYNFLAGVDNLSQVRTFKLIWQWNGPQRIKILLWKIAHNALLTNAERFRRHLTTNAKCPRCLSQDEDLLHVFRDCCFAKKL